MEINLRDTRKQGRVLERIRIDRTEDNWIHYWTENDAFRLCCGPVNLSEGIEIFVRWFESESS